MKELKHKTAHTREKQEISDPAWPDAFRLIRRHTEEICKPLHTEDYVVQPVVDISPPKWHLGHTTWFFEQFLLKPGLSGYREFDPHFGFVFNSYYESEGARVLRTDRGNLSRPCVEEIYRYRDHVNAAMEHLLENEFHESLRDVLLLGLNHEQQHQELLFTDIKYILGHNPLFPPYNDKGIETSAPQPAEQWIAVPGGVYQIGHEGDGFCFDNELDRHRVYLQEYSICNRLVTNGEYLVFMESGGYRDFRHWHSDGWEWVKQNKVESPLYWHITDGNWHQYSLAGLKPLDPQQPVTHINFYEASAYASWKGMRLPTEAEWETAAPLFQWGDRWEWTGSAYLPYPGFRRAPGALGEYNGKFMINQMVLRGASVATPPGHGRITYRNFFQPALKWQFTGIRLAQ